MQFTSSLQAAAVSPVRCGAGLEKRKCLLLLEKIRCPQRLHPERQILQKRCLPASAGRSGNGRVRSSWRGSRGAKEVGEEGIRASGFRIRESAAARRNWVLGYWVFHLL